MYIKNNKRLPSTNTTYTRLKTKATYCLNRINNVQRESVHVQTESVHFIHFFKKADF